MTLPPHFAKSKHTELFIRDLKAHRTVDAGGVQREFKIVHAMKIRDEFDPDKFGEIAVVVVAGEYLVFDGQHRLWAARESLGEDQKVPCIVYADMTIERQAQLFRGRNHALAVCAMDDFKTAVVGNEPAQTAISEILHHAGLKVGALRAPTVVRSPVALIKVYTKYGDQILRRTLGVIRGAWDRDPDAYDGIILRGVAQLLYQFSAEIEDAELSRKLSRAGGPGRMIGAARDISKAMGCSLERAITERILTIYNKGRRAEALVLSVAKKPAPARKAPRSANGHAEVH